MTEPFRDDPRFWSSVGLSVDAVLTLLVAVVLTSVFGEAGAIAFALPVGLLVVAGLLGRRSTAQTRPLFASRGEWRDAERRAVAAALPGAFLRHVRRPRHTDASG